MSARLEADESARRVVERPRPRGPRGPRRARGGARGRRGRRAAGGRARTPPARAGAFLRSIAVEGFRGIGPAADAGAAAGPGPHARRRAQRLRQVELRRGARGPAHRRQPALEGARRRLARGLAQPPPPRRVARRRRSSSRASGGRAWCRAGGRRRRSSTRPRSSARLHGPGARPTSSPSAGPRRCAPTGRSSPTTSSARSSTRGPRSSTTPSPRSWASRTSSWRWARCRRRAAPARRRVKDATEARGRLLERLRGRRRRAGAAGRGGPREARSGTSARSTTVLGGASAVGRGRGRGRRAAGHREPRAARPGAGRGRRRGDARGGRGGARRPARRPRPARATRRRSSSAPCSTTRPTATATARCAAARARSTARGAASSARRRRACARRRARRTPSTSAPRRPGGSGRAWCRSRPTRSARAAEVGLDLGALVEALGTWVKAGSISDLSALADHVESASGPLREAVVRLRDSARAELGAQGGRVASPGRRGRGLARGRARGRCGRPPT